MSTGEPTRLNNQFPSKSPTFKWFNKTFCEWGKKRLTYDIDPHILGSPAPIWKNPSAGFYRVFYILNLISSILFVVFFIIVKIFNASVQLSLSNSSSSSTSTSSSSSSSSSTSDVETNCLNYIETNINPEFIIIGSFILLVNAIMARFISKMPYASDQDWFRYLVLNFICCAGLSGFNLGEYFDFKSNWLLYTNELKVKYPSANQCIILFQVNLWSTFINMVTITVVCVVQIVKIFLNFNHFFISKEDKDARTDDKDVVVYIS